MLPLYMETLGELPLLVRVRFNVQEVPWLRIERSGFVTRAGVKIHKTLFKVELQFVLLDSILHYPCATIFRSLGYLGGVCPSEV